MTSAFPERDPLIPPPPADAHFGSDQNAWVLSRYADVLAALRNPKLWPVSAGSSMNHKIPDSAAQLALRARVLEAFSSSKLNQWQARIDRIAWKAPLDGPVDLVTEFIQPWCLAAAEIVTGSESADREQLLSAARIVSDSAAESSDHELRDRASHANTDLERYFQRASMPMAGPTFVAISRTVACLLSNGWLALLRHPAELAQLRAIPDLLPRAIEEMLRYACLPQSVCRYALESVTTRGLHIQEGERVVLRIASANRDPAQFPVPDRIDLARGGAAQLSLGFGPHSCVGAALIRMTATAATRLFVESFGCCSLWGPVEWQGGDGFRSPSTLRVIVGHKQAPA